MDSQLLKSRARYKRLTNFRKLFENMNDAVCLFELTDDHMPTQYLEVNPAACEQLGYTRAELLTMSPLDLTPASDLKNLQIALGELAIQKRVVFQGSLIAKTGRQIDVQFSIRVLRMNSRNVVVCSAHDISDYKVLKRQLETSERRYLTLFENISDAVCVFSADGRLVRANSACSRITGYSVQQLENLSMAGLIAPDALLALQAQLHDVAVGGRYQGNIIILHKNESRLEVNATLLSLVLADGSTGICFIAKDVTERRQSQEVIRHMAYHDALTGLPNRRWLTERVQNWLRHENGCPDEFAVIFLDLDRFNIVNDSLGLDLGDELLRAVSNRLRQSAPRQSLLARLSGDEFVVLLPVRLEHAEHEADIAAKAVIGVVSKSPFLLDHREFTVTVSVGIAFSRIDGQDSRTLLKHADIAMNRAKRLGGNQSCFFDSSMNVSISRQLQLENSLRKALERDEFLLHYQPKIDIATGDIIGMEALIRWNSAEMGSVSPADFIPIAEETGVIVPIGDWVLRTACEQNRRWQAAGYPPISVAVNLSARQFQNDDIVEKVRMILQDTGLSGEWLELEITESLLMQNKHTIIGALQELKKMGIQISIDDFGTGYSSLSYLKRFPIDSLKIDQSFVREISLGTSDAEIAIAVITLGHSLRLRVIAEGVETEDQLSFLRDRHCDQMQGYLFSKPISADVFEEMLIRQQAHRDTTNPPSSL